MKNWFLCRSCRKPLIDEGVGFGTPMYCAGCGACTWVYIMQEMPAREVKLAIAMVIRQLVKRLRKGV